jgi:hypothetical protein
MARRAELPPTPPVNPPKPSASGNLKFRGPEFPEWKELKPDVPEGTAPEEEQKITAAAKAAREELKNFLLSSLQMQHVVVLAGSGTSLGPTKGPSMQDLWKQCTGDVSGIEPGMEDMFPPTLTTKVIAEIGYDVCVDGQNIEALLSRCEAYRQFKPSEDVSLFVQESKRTILAECSGFITHDESDQLAAHRTFLHRLSRRRVRDSRLKVFTTNYDLCFETAAGSQGLVVLDGFSFTQPRQFDPRFFLYDIVRRPSTGEEVGTPLEGVFHLYKLHGSVNWSRKADSRIEIEPSPTPESACLIYPATGKYQQSYVQPHLELVSQYLSVLREPNTCLIVIGFGFNDDHLSEPILSAVRTNPHLRLIIVNPSAEELTFDQKNKYWEMLFRLVGQGEDVWLINANFGDFAEMIPDLKSLTPADRLTRVIKQISGTK